MHPSVPEELCLERSSGAVVAMSTQGLDYLARSRLKVTFSTFGSLRLRSNKDLRFRLTMQFESLRVSGL